jgi:hypothetical protein
MEVKGGQTIQWRTDNTMEDRQYNGGQTIQWRTENTKVAQHPSCTYGGGAVSKQVYHNVHGQTWEIKTNYITGHMRMTLSHEYSMIMVFFGFIFQF